MVRSRIIDFWRRAETGSICPTKKFDLDVFYPQVQKLIQEYDIKYDPDILIPTDDSLINDVFEAGKELLLDVGVLCTDTERIIKFLFL